MKKTITIPQLFRRIQKLKRLTPQTEETIQALEFYEQVSKKLLSLFGDDYTCSQEPINLKKCPLAKAKELALELGMHVIDGSSGTVYLCWSKGIDDEE